MDRMTKDRTIEGEVAALLDWYAAMGADEAIGEAPLDAFSVSAKPRAAPAPQQAPVAERAGGRERPPLPDRYSDFATTREPRPAPKTVTPRPVQPRRQETADMPSAGEIAKTASLAELRALVEQFDGCPLKRTAKSLCFSRGSETADLMLIGEAPGRDEDLQGKPFVGRAGQLLDKMLAAIGRAEDSVYITNTVYWRPPGNRTPTPQEIAACLPFLEQQIALLKPKTIMLLGGAAASTMLQTTQGIMRLRGKWKSYDKTDTPIPVMATLHPAFLLRNSAAKRKAWQDLLMVKQRLDSDQS
ncbi:Uracil DNA glycosylase superfamily protein [Methyloligella halotolerans]|uniref:Type-4 uracil-DNA glycosylase n=1 Tax=Methyloligella halotolerans TaxID=1177755 RepID=A0A1E2RYT7_9HYPH|nr:uracil-DNA glycosylase [Methyloligella halotolerans]ODA67268.1 Uracil DNA glycosylase superfamily protein [Methyloligella halotolerans]